MRIIGGFIGAFTCVILLAGAPSTASADNVQEVFICTLKDGKTMDDLMKVVDKWKPVVGKTKGGDSYQAWVLTPIAANNLASIVWVGQSPDMAVYGSLTEEYEGSKAGQDLDAEFQTVVKCDSRSIWRAKKVK